MEKAVLHSLIDLLNEADTDTIYKVLIKFVPKAEPYYDTMPLRLKKGAKSLIEAAAKADNESINGYVKKAVKAKYEADTGNEIDL